MILSASAETESPKSKVNYTYMWRTQYSACDLNTVSRLQLVSLLYFKFRTLFQGGGAGVDCGSEILLQDRPYVGRAALTRRKV